MGIFYLMQQPADFFAPLFPYSAAENLDLQKE
jgi:hypothetical protein